MIFKNGITSDSGGINFNHETVQIYVDHYKTIEKYYQYKHKMQPVTDAIIIEIQNIH